MRIHHIPARLGNCPELSENPGSLSAEVTKASVDLLIDSITAELETRVTVSICLQPLDLGPARTLC